MIDKSLFLTSKLPAKQKQCYSRPPVATPLPYHRLPSLPFPSTYLLLHSVTASVVRYSRSQVQAVMAAWQRNMVYGKMQVTHFKGLMSYSSVRYLVIWCWLFSPHKSWTQKSSNKKEKKKTMKQKRNVTCRFWAPHSAETVTSSGRQK